MGRPNVLLSRFLTKFRVGGPPARDAPDLGLLMRLDSVRNDGVGWLATFYGKPDIHGNSVSFPIGPEHAAQLEVGGQYLFVLWEKR